MSGIVLGSLHLIPSTALWDQICNCTLITDEETENQVQYLAQVYTAIVGSAGTLI